MASKKEIAKNGLKMINPRRQGQPQPPPPPQTSNPVRDTDSRTAAPRQEICHQVICRYPYVRQEPLICYASPVPFRQVTVITDHKAPDQTALSYSKIQTIRISG
ncbi:hypothetical protein OROHE_016705 [Orobanche hederae]